MTDNLTHDQKANRNYWLRHFPDSPTSDELRRHPERFGPESVKDIAEVYGIELNASPGREAGPRQRRNRPALRQQVLELRQRGLMPAAIADALNLSDRRVKEILLQVAA